MKIHIDKFGPTFFNDEGTAFYSDSPKDELLFNSYIGSKLYVQARDLTKYELLRYAKQIAQIQMFSTKPFLGI